MLEMWEEALRQLREKVGKQNFETWIKPIHMQSITGDGIVLGVPNKFFRDWLSEHYFPQISEVLESLTHKALKISLTINNQSPVARPEKVPRADKKEEREPHPKSPSRANNLVPKYTFENFVVGASNQFAHAASNSRSAISRDQKQ